MWTRIAGLAVGIAALLSGCAQRPAPPPAVSAPVAVAPAAVALAPALYMQLAASSALFAVRASEIAAERSGDAKLRSLAQAIAQDQRGIGAQLSFAGRRLDLLPTASLTEAQASDLDRLRASGDVAAAYRQLLDPVLARALQAHSTFAASGSSPTLKPVAQMAAPATGRNLQMLRRP